MGAGERVGWQQLRMLPTLPNKPAEQNPEAHLNEGDAAGAAAVKVLQGRDEWQQGCGWRVVHGSSRKKQSSAAAARTAAKAGCHWRTLGMYTSFTRPYFSAA